MNDLDLKAMVDEILNRRAAVGLAVGVVRNGGLEFFHAHGLADIASRTPITEDTVFRIASVTKTFTAIAVMQLWEQGLVDLDAPANDYLRAFQLVPARATHRPATLRHLLTHTAGIPQMVRTARALLLAPSTRWFGESYALDEPVPTLAEYYGGRLHLAVEPGTTFTYSDHGPATLGQIVEDVTGQTLDRYMREYIFEPLGMADSDLLRSARVTSRLATGYTLGARGAKPVIDREWVTAAASSIYSTPRDMSRYLAALVGGGSNEHGVILKRETLAKMFEPQYQPDPRLPGMGLGFWRVNLGGHPGVEHQGIIPGFNTQIFAAPNDEVAVMAFTNGAKGAVGWLVDEAGRLMRRLIGAPDDSIRTDVPQHPDVWGDIFGWYRVNAQPTDMMAWGNAGAGTEVIVRGGRLILRGLSPIPIIYRGIELHPDDPDDPYVFRLDLTDRGLGTIRVVFSRHPDGASSAMHVEMPPLSLRKLPDGANPRAQVAAALAVGIGVAVRRHRVRRRQGAPHRRSTGP